MTGRSYRPYDLIVAGGEMYLVKAQLLGAINQVSVVELEPLTERPPLTNGGKVYVPCHILDGAVGHGVEHYRPVSLEKDC